MVNYKKACASLALFAVQRLLQQSIHPFYFLHTRILRKLGPATHKAADAWALGFTGKDVRIGIADGQAQLSHPEFAGRVYSPLKPAPFPLPEYLDPSGHGTHVMGVAAAARDGIGMVGVA
jgi:subtilisin family serine protease